MTATITESETLMADRTFAELWAGCCDHPDDAGRKLIAADRANDLGFENVERGLRFEGGKKWPEDGWGWWDKDHVGCVNEKLPFSHDILEMSETDVFKSEGTHLVHFERLGKFLKEQGYE